ncbi:MAG: C4-dicarboxylate ABC transporter, partial [Peptococcaceae bacterium]|nr:C4-dicarboxylate ABC transporter [Peptococcaceae bacterium]NLI92452.1 C4-dicarboxylate ABC transporter [Peptococcaceae bacterium]
MSLGFLANTGFAKALAANMDMISLIVIVIAIIITIWKDTNLGTLALGMALVVGYFIGGI